MDNNTTISETGAPDYEGNVTGLHNVKTIKVKNLIMLVILIMITAILVFGFLYYRGTRPLENVQPVMSTSQPKYLYSIYDGNNKFLRPLAIAVGKDGTRYISNNSIHTIETVSADSRSKSSFGGEGIKQGKLLYPYGIGVLPDGNLLVAETGNFRIQEFTPKGKFVKVFVPKTNKIGLQKPGPISVDSLGRVYVGDISGSQVLILDQNGDVLSRIKNISFPHGIAVDEKNRRLYVADAGQVCVKVFSLDEPEKGPILTIAGYLPDMPFSMVRGLAVDNLGRLYVADTIMNLVRVFDKNFKYLFSFGSQGFGDGEFLYPNQIFIDKTGKIYVSDWGNNRVQVWGY